MEYLSTIEDWTVTVYRENEYDNCRYELTVVRPDGSIVPFGMIQYSPYILSDVIAAGREYVYSQLKG